MNSLFHHQRHDLEQEDPEPFLVGSLDSVNSLPLENCGLTFVMAGDSETLMFNLQRVPGSGCQNYYKQAGWAVGQLGTGTGSAHVLPSWECQDY